MPSDEYPSAANTKIANIHYGETRKRNLREIFTGTSTFHVAPESRGQSLHILFISEGLKDFDDK